jgi:hypothetical protein
MRQIHTGMDYIRNYENQEYEISRPMAQPGTSTQSSTPCSKQEADSQAKPVNACLPLPKRLKRSWHTITHRKEDIDLEEYQRCAKASFYITRVWQLFGIPRIRRATTAALVMMITQQMCGIVSQLILTFVY